MTAAATPDRKTRCRYLGNFPNRCTAEVAEEGAEIDLCPHHLAAALVLLQRRMGAVMEGDAKEALKERAHAVHAERRRVVLEALERVERYWVAASSVLPADDATILASKVIAKCKEEIRAAGSIGPRSHASVDLDAWEVAARLFAGFCGPDCSEMHTFQAGCARWLASDHQVDLGATRGGQAR